MNLKTFNIWLSILIPLCFWVIFSPGIWGPDATNALFYALGPPEFRWDHHTVIFPLVMRWIVIVTNGMASCIPLMQSLIFSIGLMCFLSYFFKEKISLILYLLLFSPIFSFGITSLAVSKDIFFFGLFLYSCYFWLKDKKLFSLILLAVASAFRHNTIFIVLIPFIFLLKEKNWKPIVAYVLILSFINIGLYKIYNFKDSLIRNTVVALDIASIYNLNYQRAEEAFPSIKSKIVNIENFEWADTGYLSKYIADLNVVMYDNPVGKDGTDIKTSVYLSDYPKGLLKVPDLFLKAKLISWCLLLVTTRDILPPIEIYQYRITMPAFNDNNVISKIRGGITYVYSSDAWKAIRILLNGPWIWFIILWFMLFKNKRDWNEKVPLLMVLIYCLTYLLAVTSLDIRYMYPMVLISQLYFIDWLLEKFNSSVV